ncbi:hypothetical protein LG302_00900 [Halomonas organivorans]
MKLLDRTLQRDLLNQLAEAYPDARRDVLEEGDRHGPVSVNLHYLQEHGLVRIGKPPARVLTRHRDNDGSPRTTYRAVSITAAGIDFLDDDGGLSAILGTVTVRLHADTIRDLIEAKILESDDVPEEDKPRLVAALKGMREEGLRQLTQRLVAYGLDQGAVTSHNLFQWITG